MFYPCQKYTLAKPSQAKPSLTNPPFAKSSILLCCALALAACGGGGGDDGATNSNNTVNQAPTNVAFNKVEAINASTIEAIWSLAKDDKTIASTMRYQVHLSESANFTPSSTTLKFEQRGALTTQLSNLKASTTYFVKLVVIDEDNAPTISAEKSVTTPAVAVTNQAPTNVVLGNVTAASQTAVDVVWTAANDDTTPANQLTYEVHLAEGGDFSPTASTLKFSGKNALNTQLTGLKAATSYSVKLVVVDAQGAKTVSAVKSVTTLSNTLQEVSPLNDTGITQCVNQNNVMGNCDTTHLAGWFGYSQDAQIGRDALAAKGQLSKVGGGDAGFDFTKISATGQKLPANATTWSCVLDNVTGFMWENKTADNGLHDKDNTYTWYSLSVSTNGGNAGSENNSKNTLVFVNTVNIQGLCGYKDWRLPSVQELQSIVHFGKSPAIDHMYFLNTQTLYWTSLSVANDSDSAWVVNFGLGYDGDSDKSSSKYVRLVRGGQ